MDGRKEDTKRLLGSCYIQQQLCVVHIHLEHGRYHEKLDQQLTSADVCKTLYSVASCVNYSL